MATVSIPLTRGKVAIIDEEDAELVHQYNWCLHIGGGGNQYALTTPSQGHPLFMHRLILNVSEAERVDHRDGDGLNNTRANLRKATPAQNSANQKRSRANTSGYKGVSWHKQARSWHARIQSQGHNHSLGYYRNVEDAARAYDRAALSLFGEFANVNFPNS